MRRSTKLGPLLCAGAMLTALFVFAGCQQEEKTSATDEQPTPKTVEPESKTPVEPVPPAEPEPAPPVEPGLVPPTEPGLVPPTEPGLVPPFEPEPMPPFEPGLEPPFGPGLVPPVEPGLEPPTEPGIEPPTEPGLEPPLGAGRIPGWPVEPGLEPPIGPGLVPSIDPSLIPPDVPGVPDAGLLEPPSEPGVAPGATPPEEPGPMPPTEPEAAKEPDLGPPLVEKAEDLRRLDPVKPLWVDQTNGRVVMVGQVCQTDVALEMFACLKDTKEHESIVTVDVEAFKVHAGLLAIGAEAGHPVQWNPEYAPATGGKIEITLSYKDDQGQIQTARAQEWVYDTATRKAMTHDWVFGGSGFWEDEMAGTKEYKAEGGDFICVANFNSAMLDLPIESSQADSDRMFNAFTENIPPVGTAVTLTLKPKPKEAEAGNETDAATETEAASEPETATEPDKTTEPGATTEPDATTEPETATETAPAPETP